MQINHSETFISLEDTISKALEKLRSILNFKNVLLAAGFLALVWIVFYYNSRDIQLKIAYNGYGPQDYVAQKLHPENFKKDFAPGLILIYDNSIPMKVYYYLAKYFGISPSKTIYPFMFLQTLLFFLSVAFLAQTLFKNNFVTSICVIVISVSNLAGLNLSRFGAGYGPLLSFPLFYGYSNAFRFFALGFFLKNKYILCFIFLALSIYCHVNMGLFALAFICGYFLFRPRLFRDKNLLIGVLIFVVLVIPHILSILSISNTTTSGGIPVDQWVKSTKIFSFHWYPITMKLFTQNAHMDFFPFLLLCFFFFVALRYQDIKDEKNLKIIVGSIACMVMGILGVVFSDVYPIPFLIKISLQRATGLITFFGVLYIIYYIYRKMDIGNIANIFLAAFSLLILVFAKPGIAVLPLFLVLFADMREGYFGPIKMSTDKIKIAQSSYYIIAFLLILLTLICTFQDKIKIANIIFIHIWTPLQYFNPLDGFDFLLRGGGLKVSPIFVYLLIGSSVITGAKVILRDAKKRSTFILFLSIFCVISISIVCYLERDKYLSWHNRYADTASSYLDVQLWAKNNTPSDALFMPDPSHYYGWRDFSERSSFGNLREWGYSAIAYNPDKKKFEEGLKRLAEYGIDITKINSVQVQKNMSFPYSSQFDVNVRRLFNNMNIIQMQKLSEDYGIDFFIINKNFRQTPIKNLFKMFKIAYSNDIFFVFKTGRQESFFENTFSKWIGKDKISIYNLSRSAAPLTIQGGRGDFSFNRIREFDRHILRVYSDNRGQMDDDVIQFGYNLNEYGFDLDLHPGQDVIFLVDARLSDKTKITASIFIQDKVKNWDKKSTIIDKTYWGEYVVSKKIRNGAKRVCFGITWEPTKASEWIDIKELDVIPIK